MATIHWRQTYLTEGLRRLCSAARPAHADGLSIAGQQKGHIEVALGCDGYPAHPEDVYRPLAAP